MAVTIYSGGIPVTIDDRRYMLDGTISAMGAGFEMSEDREELWRTQPALRMVTGFLAANIAQVPLHAFRRSGSDRVRLGRSEPLSVVLRSPDRRRRLTGFELMHALVLDVCLWDRYCAQVFRDDFGGWQIVRIPPSMWAFDRDGMGAPRSIEVARRDGAAFSVGLDEALWIDGHPSDHDTSPIGSLLGVLREEGLAAEYRSALWSNGGRMPGWIERPSSAPRWSSQAAETFKAGWHEYAAGGLRSGRSPVLEDDMKYHELSSGITPETGQQLESRRFALGLVAAAFQLSPQVVAVLDGGSYASVSAYRESLYNDTLGAWFQRIGQAINERLVPIVSPGGGEFAEFNVAEKLRLAFEDQARIFQTSTGGPIMTRNEARQRLNLPSIDGADELIVPLNVITGGQASPTDSAPEATP